MGKRFIVTHVDQAGETIRASDAPAEDVLPTVVGDALAAGILADYDDEARRAAAEMVARMGGFEDPWENVEGRVYGRDYRVEELPESPEDRDELLNARLRSPKLLRLVKRYPESKLRYVIYPNESKHPGRPHCTAATRDKSANFSIPEATHLVGDIRPHEKEAVRTIFEHGAELLELWYRMRPDDQKLAPPPT